MRKLLYLALGAIALFPIQSCGNKSAQQDADTDNTDSIAPADSLAAVRADSLAKVQADSIARADSLAKADSIAASQKKNSAQIDGLLNRYAGLAEDVRNTFYDQGDFYPGTALHQIGDGLPELDRKLKALEGDMTPEQKARFKKLHNSIKEALAAM